MSYLPQTNWGDCTQCSNKNCACVKKGKVLICTFCNNANKAKKQIANANERNKLRSLKQVNVPRETSDELDDKVKKENWFKERRREMTGRCLFCGSKTEKYNDKTYKNSIAHLLAKRPTMFPSVATNKDNWLELCFYNNSCHANFDNCMITWEFLKDSLEWKVIVDKFKKIYPFIAEKEKKNIPELLLKEISNGV